MNTCSPCRQPASLRPAPRVAGWLPPLLLIGGLAAPVAAAAATLWTGPRVVFTKADGADPSQAANQDRLTPTVWLTRGSREGLYNAAREASFAHSSSPADTEWATGTTADYASLTYRDWESWTRSVGKPPGTPGVNAVLHLKTDDIYIDVKFLSWSARANGGGFAYERSTPGAFLTSADCVFDWGEANYPSLLPPPRPRSQTVAPYYFRHYPATNTYVGISSEDQHLYFLDASTSAGLLDLGPASVWIAAAGCP